MRPSCGRAEISNIFTGKPPWRRPFSSTKGLEFISAISLKRTPPVPSNLRTLTQELKNLITNDLRTFNSKGDLYCVKD